MAKLVVVTVQVLFEDRWSVYELRGIKTDCGVDGDGEFLRWLADQVDTDPNITMHDYDIVDPAEIDEDEDDEDEFE